VVIALGMDAGLLPEAIEIAVRPLLEEVILVFGRGAQRGIAARSGPARQIRQP
jgi:hypothetical protein